MINYYYLVLSMIGTVTFVMSIFLIFNITRIFSFLTISLINGNLNIIYIVFLLGIIFFIKLEFSSFFMWYVKKVIC